MAKHRIVAALAITMLGGPVLGQRGMGGVARVPGAGAVGRQWVLAIGINQYKHWQKWASLRGAVADAKAVVKVLRERYYVDRVHALYDADATRDNIIEKLREMAGQTAENDSLLIYYAGHGNLDEIEKTSFWIPVDGTDRATTWISSKRVKGLVANMKAKHVLLISDSCFSGDFFGSRSARPTITEPYYRRAHELPSRQALTSGLTEPVADVGLGGHSPFAYFLLKALRRNRQAYLVANELFDRIKVGIARNASQTPRVGPLQGAGDEGGEFIFFLQPQYIDPNAVSPSIAAGAGAARRPPAAGGQASATLAPPPGIRALGDGRVSITVTTPSMPEGRLWINRAKASAAALVARRLHQHLSQSGLRPFDRDKIEGQLSEKEPAELSIDRANRQLQVTYDLKTEEFTHGKQ